MNFPRLATAVMLASALAACGGYEDASSDAEADTVEIPANEALAGVDGMPVADPDANADIVGSDTVAEAADENGDSGNASSAAPVAGPAPAEPAPAEPADEADTDEPDGE